MVGVVDVEVLPGMWSTFPAPDWRTDSFQDMEPIADGTEIVAIIVTSEAMQ
jgi:hypothetical protein